MSKEKVKPTKGEMATLALADVLRAFKDKRDGAMTRKAWSDFKNSIIPAIEKILEHDL